MAVTVGALGWQEAPRLAFSEFSPGGGLERDGEEEENLEAILAKKMRNKGKFAYA